MRVGAEPIAANEWNEWVESDAKLYEGVAKDIGIDTNSRRLSHGDRVAIELAYRLRIASDLANSGGYEATPQEMAEVPSQVFQGLKQLQKAKMLERVAQARDVRSASTLAKKCQMREKIHAIVQGCDGRGGDPRKSQRAMNRLRRAVAKQLGVRYPLSREVEAILSQELAACWPSTGG